MNTQQPSIVYALVQLPQRGNLVQQIAKRNVILAGCSIYYFDRWGDLLTSLLTTPDERLPVLIALDPTTVRAENLDGLSWLRNSRRLSAIPTLLVETNARSTAVAFALA